jgi:uncharacterized protein (TIGR02996 family)
MTPLPAADVKAFVEAIRQEPRDRVRSAVFADWLSEQGATLADVLRLYAEPPRGLEVAIERTYPPNFLLANLPPYREDIAITERVRRLEDGSWRVEGMRFTIPHEDDCLRELVAEWEEREGRVMRAEGVRRVHAEAHAYLNQPADPLYRIVGGILGSLTTESKASAWRWIKRAVLSLFDADRSLRMRLKYTFSLLEASHLRGGEDMIRRILASGGFRTDLPFQQRVDEERRCVVFTQELKPSEWIPPAKEESPRWRAGFVRREGG